jgi:cysteine desulfurase
MRIYLDNAATTQPDPAVIEAMLPYWSEHFGNPSSIHSFGRESKSALELARKKVAMLAGASPSEIFFTSGGTEADNTALHGLAVTYGIKNIISSPLEHHAVLHTLEDLKSSHGINIHFLNVDERGDFDISELAELMEKFPSSLVTLMHANNETGNISDIGLIGDLCSQYNAFFHSDTVQTIGKLPVNLQELKINSLAGSAHKFHGPKGAGFLYVRGSSKIKPYIHGGGQERNMRSGTENVAGVVGLAKALEIAVENMEKNRVHIFNLKRHMIGILKEKISGVQFNGLSDDEDKSLYTILNVSIPPSGKLDMLLFQLDLKDIAVSGGSACASGALQGSHVLTAMKKDPQRPVVRFSFSKFNTLDQINQACEILAEIINSARAIKK